MTERSPLRWGFAFRAAFDEQRRAVIHGNAARHWIRKGDADRAYAQARLAWSAANRAKPRVDAANDGDPRRTAC